LIRVPFHGARRLDVLSFILDRGDFGDVVVLEPFLDGERVALGMLAAYPRVYKIEKTKERSASCDLAEFRQLITYPFDPVNRKLFGKSLRSVSQKISLSSSGMISCEL
jgi:hypothetical protein